MLPIQLLPCLVVLALLSVFFSLQMMAHYLAAGSMHTNPGNLFPLYVQYKNEHNPHDHKLPWMIRFYLRELRDLREHPQTSSVGTGSYLGPLPLGNHSFNVKTMIWYLLWCLVSNLFKWSWYPVCIPKHVSPCTQSLVLRFVTASNTEVSPTALCEHWLGSSVSEREPAAPRQHKGTPPRESWQGVGVRNSSQGTYWKHLILFPALGIYSLFHANGIIWSMNVLGKGKRGIKKSV